MKAKFVTKQSVQIFDLDKAPFNVTGTTDDLSELRKQGRCVHRAELDNQPTFEGFLGPMWDGGMLRYETQEVYDMFWD